MQQPVIIKKLSWEFLLKAAATGSIDAPSWTEAQEKIQELNEIKSGSVFLEAVDGGILSIGGQRGVGFVVNLSKDENHICLMADEEDRHGRVVVLVGLQPGDFPKRIVVGFPKCLKVAHIYFITGMQDPTEEWTSDFNTTF